MSEERIKPTKSAPLRDEYGEIPKDPLARDGTMALRAVGLEFQDPFNRKRVRITAPSDAFVEKFIGPKV